MLFQFAESGTLTILLGAVRTQRGFFRCGYSQFLMQKTSNFEIYGVSARTKGEGGLSQCEQGGSGVNFSRFCADVLLSAIRCEFSLTCFYL